LGGIGKAAAALGRPLRRPFVWGVGTGVVLVVLIRGGNTLTSSDSFCEACHTHPQATSSWIQSTHYATKSGTVVHCVECHLPPGGVGYATEKARLGIRDAFGTIFKNRGSFDWERRSQLEHARRYTFRESCLECHPNLFPVELTDKGEEAHLHYERRSDEVRCLNCHLHVGHYDPDAAKEIEFGLVEIADVEIFDAPATVEGFVDYTEFIPGTRVSFEMVAIPGGRFEMGSPESEPYRQHDEEPVHTVQVSPFWMGRVEVTWDEFEAWYRATRSEGRTDTRQARVGGPLVEAGVDAVTGATPPYVPPDQGWGKGQRPAITMTHHAAQQYTRWLSTVTGKRYRLPTEAEWEYAARAGTQTPYFFEGDPNQYTERRFWNRLLGADTEVLDSFVVHAGNSGGRTQPPDEVAPNPFGLVNMLGNVREFCLDWYAPDAYEERASGTAIVDPRGPATGTEHVVRGGSFRSDPADLRTAARDRTRSDACRITDPQAPKSIWWYSDCTDTGFRVVREMTLEGDQQ
jgi:formylglycine-generating enzyme required for sulfatase activity/nitrate/TMAO reductase-like tetraheme cytochrome c subunit